MGRPKIILYFDLQSPYSYLAFHFINTSDAFKAYDITYIPVVIFAFIKAIGLVPPWNNPNKVKYVQQDLARLAHFHNIPWASGWPEKYPNTLTVKVQRALVACSLEAPRDFVRVISALHYAFWVEKKAVQLPEVFEGILVDNLGEPLAMRIAQRSHSDEIKDLLRQNTNAAWADGAFGLPWIKAVNAAGEQEEFWGFDRLGQAMEFLHLDRIVSPML